jgi:hypothetical protein
MSAAASSPSSASEAALMTLLHHPLQFVDAQLLAAAGSVSPATAAELTAFAQSDWNIPQTIVRLLGLHEQRSTPANKIAMIPSLNSLPSATALAHLRPNQLVRFRGMVQETFQPEYYPGVWTPGTQAQGQRIRTGKFRMGMDAEVSAGTSRRQRECFCDCLQALIVAAFAV